MVRFCPALLARRCMLPLWRCNGMSKVERDEDGLGIRGVFLQVGDARALGRSSASSENGFAL